jgi:hypothetical protein
MEQQKFTNLNTQLSLFMEPEMSLPSSLQHDTGPYPESS